VRFLVDNQLPPALVHHLRAQGYEAAHVLDLGLDEADDLKIWSAADRDGWIIIAKDEDFSKMVVLRQEKVQILWVRLGNCRKTALLEALDRSWEGIKNRLSHGDGLVELY
jgi:predicted nuclease of predicted toxin-antitoxin system